MKKIYLFYFLLLLGFNKIQAQAGCLSDIVISGSYATTYTNSYTWIKTSGLTTIPTGSDVTLDANPVTDGYVLMDIGFETQPNSIFLAIVQTPCVSLGIKQDEVMTNLSIFPNPVSDVLAINSEVTILKTAIYDVQGKLLVEQKHNQNQIFLKTDSFSAGIYFLKVESADASKTFKISKL